MYNGYYRFYLSMLSKRKIFITVSILVITLCYLLFSIVTVRADELSDIEQKLSDLNRALSMSVAATAPLESDLTRLQNQLNDIKRRTALIEAEVEKKQTQVDEGEKLLGLAADLLGQKVRQIYKSSSQFSSSRYLLFLRNNLTEAIRQFGYERKVIANDRDTIVKVVLYIKDLEQKKKELTDEKNRLAKIKEETDKQAVFLDKEITGAKKYQNQLSSQIAQLSARQKELLAQKLASLGISRSAASIGRCDSDLSNGRDPGFSPRFGIFTYGVPNRVGLNQWGAYGRAKAGQGYDTILHAYYNFDGYQNFDNNIKINVSGSGSFSLEDYVKRIYEVPGDWPSEVLKAQAIAARSYALAYTNNGSNSICATESCQVFKSDPKGGAWEQAVNDTSGKAMVQAGKPIKAWFSSTHGGYVHTSGEIGWSDTSWTKHATDASNGINNFSDLTNNSYDRESPWFYCDWGSRGEYNKTAWLKSEELADIVNAILLARKDSSTQEHLYQPDSPPAGTDTWNPDRVRQELKNHGMTPFNNISSMSVSADFSSGRTTSVSVSGDAGSENFDGGEFKNFFNLRAPANIQIVGPLYNIEKK
jgi:SpoIID/LytB domain protein